MIDLVGAVNKIIETPNVKEAINAKALDQLNINQLTTSLVAAIQAVIPPVLAGGFSASAAIDKTDTGATISLEFLNKERNSFTGAVWNIYGLFSQGWNYEGEKIPPRGIWHGKWTRAKPARVAEKFIESGVEAWKASLPDGVTVDDQYIDEIYT